MGDQVIVAYRPKPGREEALLALTRTHVAELRALGFATDRPALAMQAKDGTVVEVFEWAEGALDKAHAHPAVHAMWACYGEVCDFVPLSALAEARDMFATFRPVDL